MTSRAEVVSILPWFKVHPGKLGEFKALLPRFVAQTSTEPGCLFYDFTLNGDVVHCRESYRGAGAALAHIQNVGALLGEASRIADLQRLEIHGAAAELAKMKEPLKALPVEWFVLEVALER